MNTDFEFFFITVWLPTVPCPRRLSAGARLEKRAYFSYPPDASIMPTMLSANLNAAVIMIGDKASDMALGKMPLEAVAPHD